MAKWQWGKKGNLSFALSQRGAGTSHTLSLCDLHTSLSALLLTEVETEAQRGGIFAHSCLVRRFPMQVCLSVSLLQPGGKGWDCTWGFLLVSTYRTVMTAGFLSLWEGGYKV